MDGEVIRLYTETAWSPCNEVFDLVREKYPSLYYYFQAEEPGMGIYETNDISGVYFPDRYFLMPVRPKKSTSANTSRIRKMRSSGLRKRLGNQ